MGVDSIEIDLVFYQMLKQFNESFFILNVAKVINEVTDREYPCKAMKKVPKLTFEYQTQIKVDEAGFYFNADLMKEASQKHLCFISMV